MTPVASLVGSNRIIPGAGIVHPVGSAGLAPESETALRRRIVEKALASLQEEIEEQKLF